MNIQPAQQTTIHHEAIGHQRSQRTLPLARKFIITAIAAALVAPVATYSALSIAADKPAVSNKAVTDNQEQAMQKFSQAGSQAFQELHAARLAIFNGEPKEAQKLLDGAKEALHKAESEAPTLSHMTTMMVGGKVVGTTTSAAEMKFVPVDVQISVADDYVLTPEKKGHIDKANEHFRQKRHAEAKEELRLAGIDVNFTRLWMPIEQSQKGLEQAIKQVKEGKYYEANLSLKAIEDGIRVDTVSSIAIPQPKESAPGKG